MNREMEWLRAVQALAAVGITTYGPRLVALVTSILDAVEAAGPSADEERLEKIADALVGPNSICPDCLFGLARESFELLCGESDMASEAESVIEALGMTIWTMSLSIAHERWSRLKETDEAYASIVGEA